MPERALTSTQKKTIQKASRSAVENEFVQLKGKFSRGKWINATNRYGQKTVARLSKDNNGRIRNTDLAQYIAASAVLHCADGWAFVGRSIDAHSHGDADSARHLGYYAELRGALSLLAIEGIGIFDNNNYVIDHLGDCVKIVKASGTHWLTWKSLEHWAGLRRSTELLAEVIQPAGLPLNDWLISFNAGTTVRPLGTRWLRTWGLDLKDLSKDRDLRNESSYRPTRLLQKAALDPVESSESLRSLWRVCEPSTAPFEPLDRYLLKMSLIEVYKGLYGTHPSQNLSLYERRTTQMVEDLGFSSSLSEEWIRYFKDFSKIQLPSSFQIPRLDPTSKIHGTMFMLQHGLFFCYVSRLGHVREHWPGRK